MRPLIKRTGALVVMLLLAGACSSNLDSTAADSGLVIQTEVGPSCPVMHQDEACPDQPLSAALEIANPRGQIVARVKTDQEGQARVALPAGDYIIRPLSESPVVPPVPPSPVRISLQEGDWMDLLLTYDSGIR